MNSIIILLVISVLFLDVFFSVSNEAIVVVFSQEELWLVEAWGTAGGCHQLQSGGVLREVFDSGGS